MMVTFPMMNGSDTITVNGDHVVSVKDFREKDGSVKADAASLLMSDGQYVLVGVSRSEAVDLFIRQPPQNDSTLKGE